MPIACLTHLFTPLGLFVDGDEDGLPDGLNAAFSVGWTPGAIDLAARLGLETTALTPGFTRPDAPGIPVFFGPANSACPILDVPQGCGVVALTEQGLVVTGASDEAGWAAARWLAETFPFVAPGGPLLADQAGGRPVHKVLLRDGTVIAMEFGSGPVESVDKPTLEGQPDGPPFLAEAPGDLPPPGSAQLFTVAGLMGSSDSARHDLAGWQVQITAALTPGEIAGLCELAARTGVEATGLRFPLAVDVDPAGTCVRLADQAPVGRSWVEGHLAWEPGCLTAFGTPAQRADGLCQAAQAGLVEGLHATLFTRRAALPEEPIPQGDLVFDLVLDQEWEVDRFRRLWSEQVMPALAPGSAVQVDLRISEPLAVRETLAEELATDLAERGVPEGHIRILSAYKQGFHWLEEEIMPRLREVGPIGRVQVSCAPFGSSDGGARTGEALEMDIRWLQELYPADELLAAALGAPVQFDLAESSQAHIYELIAYGPDGTVILTESFSPVHAARPYMPEFPLRGQVHPSTGFLRVEQGGRTLLETAFDTDTEAFWTAYQWEVLPRLRQYLAAAWGPAPEPGAQPFFGALVVEAALSEDDRRLGIREEQISPLDALHEDIYFHTLDYLNELGLSLVGQGYPAPGAVEPWIAAGSRGPRSRVRLFARPQVETLLGGLPQRAADLPAPAGGIPMDLVIGPEQLPPYLAYLATLPGVRVWRSGLSFAGRATWALAATAPTAGQIAPPQKLSAWRPTLLVNARRHANEVSSTNALLKLAELAATQGLTRQVNLVISPMENVDGAHLHYAMQQVHPTWKLHAARFNAAGVDFGFDAFLPNPQFGEARTLPTLWRAFLPDVLLDDHGYPSHEWVQPFSGYSSAPYFRTSWWMPNACIYGIFRWMDGERFPANGAVQEAIRDALAERLTADREIADYTRTLLDRYVQYGQRYVPGKFPLQMHKGFISLTSKVSAGPDARSFVGRFPHITQAELVTEVPDETAQGAYLNLCSRAHLEGDLAVLGYLARRQEPVVRRRSIYEGQVLWTVGRLPVSPL